MKVSAFQPVEPLIIFFEVNKAFEKSPPQGTVSDKRFSRF